MKTLGRWLKLIFGQWKDYRFIKQNKKATEKNGVVLILRLDAIGDFVLFLDSARAYRELFPDERLVLLCNKACVPFGVQSGFFDECITPGELKGTERTFELLVQTVYAKTREIDVIAASIPAVKKISIRPDGSRVNLSRTLTSRRIREAGDAIYDELIDTGREDLMELDRNAAFVRGLGWREFRSDLPVLKLPEKDPKEKLQPVPDALKDKGKAAISAGEKYYIVFPGASSRNKMWPAGNYAEVIDQIYDKTGMKCLVCGAPGEEWIFEELKGILGEREDHEKRIINLIGRTSLPELAEVIRDAEFLIGNDTSGIHIAAAVGTRCVCIAGDFVYGRFIPYHTESEPAGPLPVVVHAGTECAGCAYRRKTLRCLWSVLTKRQFECISKIPAGMVMQALSDNDFIP